MELALFLNGTGGILTEGLYFSCGTGGQSPNDSLFLIQTPVLACEKEQQLATLC